jgi:hypothetical protein
LKLSELKKETLRELKSYFLMIQASRYLKKAEKAMKVDIELSQALLEVAMKYQRMSREMKQ